MEAVVIALICLLGIALSVKSIMVLGGTAPWTSAGWWLTVVYFIAVIAKATVASALPAFAEYAVLAVLTVVFVFAGVRDERQAEPWWWPTRRGATRGKTRHDLVARTYEKFGAVNRASLARSRQPRRVFAVRTSH